MTVENKEIQEQEDLIKSIDSLIDELFTEEEVNEQASSEEEVVETEDLVEKSMIKDMGKPATKADQVKAEASEKDKKRKNAGRPKEISDVPETDQDGKRSGSYDSDIASKNEDASKKEDDQVKLPKELIKKAWEESEEYQEYIALKKAKEEAEREETLQKARAEQADLIKSAVLEATEAIRKENEELRKFLEEQAELIKSMANKPQRNKAVTRIEALEKGAPVSNKLSKAELLDVAEKIALDPNNQQFTVEHVVELENSGYIQDNYARAILEREIKKLR